MNESQPANLSNWREAPQNRWAFSHIDQLIPCDRVLPGASSLALPYAIRDFSSLRLADTDDGLLKVEDWLRWSHTDSFMILHQGKVVLEWQSPEAESSNPHILFSVSKSITGLLLGILWDRGLVDFDRTISHYLDDMSASGYADCTVQQVLDMTAAISFEEAYLDPENEFARYRAATGWNPAAESGGVHLREFLAGLRADDSEHGEVFRYLSPNSDLLGCLIEQVSGMRYAEAMSQLLWQPMGAESPAMMTVDGEGTPRAAGGICCRTADLLRVGELMRLLGQCGETRIVSEAWVHNTISGGSHEAWARGSFSHLLPEGRYHNQWYQVGNESGAFFAIGIHGQWLYVDPVREAVIAKFSSQPDPVYDPMDYALLAGFDSLAKFLAA